MADTPTIESSSQPLSTPKTMEATNSLALDLEKFEASFKLRMCAVIQELWDSQRELQAFRQRMDVSETEMVETRVKFEGSQNKFARELHDLTSSLNDRLRRLDERQAATTERLDRSDTDVQKLRQEIRQPPMAQQPQSSAAPRNQDDQQPPQEQEEVVVKRPVIDEEQVSTASESDEPRTSSTRASATKRRKVRAVTKQPSASRSQPIATNKRLADFRRYRKDTDDRHQQNPPMAKHFRRFVYGFIEGISDKAIRRTVEESLIQNLPDSFRYGKAKREARVLVYDGSSCAWHDIGRVVDSVEETLTENEL